MAVFQRSLVCKKCSRRAVAFVVDRQNDRPIVECIPCAVVRRGVGAFVSEIDRMPLYLNAVPRAIYNKTGSYVATVMYGACAADAGALKNVDATIGAVRRVFKNKREMQYYPFWPSGICYTCMHKIKAGLAAAEVSLEAEPM
jgi:hypothetical protein